MIALDRLTVFLARLIHVLDTQDAFRRTQDSRLRTQLPKMVLDLRNDASLLVAQLRAAALTAEAEALAETTAAVRLFVAEGGAA